MTHDADLALLLKSCEPIAIALSGGTDSSVLLAYARFRDASDVLPDELTEASREALALLTAGSGPKEQLFGLGTALASAMRKIVDALPEGHQVAANSAAQRFLVNPETDLLSRRLSRDELPDATLMVPLVTPAPFDPAAIVVAWEVGM